MFETEFETSDSETSDSEETSLIKKKGSFGEKSATDVNDAPRTSASLIYNEDIIAMKPEFQIEKFKYEKIIEINEVKDVDEAIQTIHPFSIDPFELIGLKDDAEIKRQSWLTIENQTTLQILSVAKRGFALIDYIIEFFNKHSKDFRIVSHILSKEKFLLKKEYANTQTPGLMGVIYSADEKHKKSSLYEILECKDNNKIIYEAAYEIDTIFSDLSRLDKILSSVFYFLISQSELICYFFMILNHLKSASLLSIPLPISVFLWAMLCIPRPTKTYWISIITYVELIVVVKYIFQFNLFPWNQDNYPNSASLINSLELLGIEHVKKDIQFAIYDLFVLLSVFLHRTILKVSLESLKHLKELKYYFLNLENGFMERFIRGRQ